MSHSIRPRPNISNPPPAAACPADSFTTDREAATTAAAERRARVASASVVANSPGLAAIVAEREARAAAIAEADREPVETAAELHRRLTAPPTLAEIFAPIFAALGIDPEVLR